jgi:plasmid maintenance system antidote protein VapI
MGISRYWLSKEIGVPAMRINKIVRAERVIIVDMAFRLSRYFYMSKEF